MPLVERNKGPPPPKPPIFMGVLLIQGGRSLEKLFNQDQFGFTKGTFTAPGTVKMGINPVGGFHHFRVIAVGIGDYRYEVGFTFGRHSNQAIITRGARPDIQMASLTCDPCCLVLTGGDEPAEYVKAEALQKGVPMIVVDTKTIETADSWGGLLDLATSHSKQKIQRFLHLLEEHADMDALASLAFG